MDWISGALRRVGSDTTTAGATAAAAAAPGAPATAEKLRGYYDLAKEAGTRAIEADEQQRRGDALRLYATALEVTREALRLQVPLSSGLSARADNVASWRQQLAAWQAGISDRLAQLERDAAAGGGGGGRPDARRIMAPPPRLLPDPPPPPPSGPPPRHAVSVNLPLPRGAAQQQQQQQRAATAAPAGGGGGGLAGAAAAAAGAVRAALTREDERLRQIVLGEVLEPSSGGGVTFDDVAGLALAKQALREAVVLPTLRADIFSGLRSPARGILLYGPPGNGKTMLARALAGEARATFFAISAASLTSKWVGEGEKLVRTLFAVAAERQPSVVFIDEIDSLLSARSPTEHDAARRLKTEFLVQFDGIASSSAAAAAPPPAAAAGGGRGGGYQPQQPQPQPSPRVVVVGATNRPHELDDAVRRRLVKRIYIPLPDAEGRAAILAKLLATGGGGGGGGGGGVAHGLSRRDLAQVVAATDGYSASDLTALCREAALAPVRELGAAVASAPLSSIRPVRLCDFEAAMRLIRPSLDRAQLKAYEDFTRAFGASA